MCGITGYIGKLPASIEAINALSILEYRGYDSAGIAASNGKNIITKKLNGYVEELKKEVLTNKIFLSTDYYMAIAHTRWATHGKPTMKNAHPHLSCNNEIAIVHNGIIENYEEIKEMLIHKGHVFNSETDSEVIAHLIEEHMKSKTFIEATKKALEMLKGTYGLAILSSKHDCIICARLASPLKIGVANHGFYISSDVNALIGRAQKYLSLNDGQIAIIKRDSYKIEGNAELKAISFTKDEVSKGAFPTYMLKEIFEQEKAVRMALSGKSNFGRLKLLKEQINKGNAEYGLGDIGSINVSYMKKVKRIALIGAGTSYHACLLGSYLFNSINDFEAHAFLSSEAIKTIKPHYDLYIFISQSGETADTIEVLRQVNKMGKPTFGICNVPGSTIAEETMGGKFTYAGPELSVASTKSFTTQLAVLYLMYLYFKAVNNIDVEQELKELERLPEKIGKCIMENDKKAKDLAYEIGNSNYLIYIGRNLYYPIALEGALKMKEIAYIPCIAYAGGELKHGPLALVNENTNVIAINPENEAKHEMESNIKEVEARRGNIILISDHNANFNLPKTMPVFYPILSILPLQLLAHHTATIKGNNIDKPRNLAKSVTVK